MPRQSNPLMQQYITQALFSLLDTQPYENITVNEIVCKAGVSRATFYRYYHGKEEILLCCLHEQMGDFQRFAQFKPHSEDDVYEVLFGILTQVKQNKRLLRLLLDRHLEGYYLQFLNESLAEGIRLNRYNSGKYSPYFFSGSLFNVTCAWLREDCEDSVKTVAEAYTEYLFARRASFYFNL